jgi:amino acid transporter
VSVFRTKSVEASVKHTEDSQHRLHRRLGPVDLIVFGVGVIILRRRRPDLRRSFKVPFNPVLPILAALICVYLMLNLSVETWIRFVVWMALGFVIYFTYSRNHSLLATGEKFEEGEVPFECGRVD